MNTGVPIYIFLSPNHYSTEVQHSSRASLYIVERNASRHQ